AIHRDGGVVAGRLKTPTRLRPRSVGEDPEDERGDDPAIPDLVFGAVDGEPDSQDQRADAPDAPEDLRGQLVGRLMGPPRANAEKITTAAPRKNAASTWKKSNAWYTAARLY
ncbi:MAG TPA: hypothetical protein VKA88_08090, partial [Solirubrobacterales bacterium]|nr:hypothetical protein [Solirubrobacterales bacterium]